MYKSYRVEGPEIKEITNLPPSFESALPEVINVEYSEEIASSQEEVVFEYTSPRAIDQEDNTIYFAFDGIEGYPFVQIKE